MPEPTPEERLLVAEFKRRWAAADASGQAGHRVEQALLPILRAVRHDAWAEGYRRAISAHGGSTEWGVVPNPYRA